MENENINPIIEEVLDEIKSALEDSRGLIAHQRRISLSISLGCGELIEQFFKKQGILKSGARIDHRWLKKKKENAKEHLSRQISGDINSIKNIDKILELAFKIESERNSLAYGKPVNEDTLQNKINLFFELKKELENA